MDVNPFSMLEVTLEESSDTEVQINFNKGEEEDPLNITNDANNLNFPSLPLFGRSAAALEKVCHNSTKLAQVSGEELKYRSVTFSDVDLVLKSRLHCTICGIHIGCKPFLISTDVTHPLLGVLCCDSCTRKYRYVEFPVTPFGQDVRCRWCACPGAVEANPLRYCSNCPFAFCEKCISRNFPTVKRCKDFWICFVCHIRQLWPARALLSSLLKLVAERCSSKSWVNDISQCCTTNGKKRIIRKPKNIEESVTIPPQCSLLPVNNLTIETKWIKDRFCLISVALKEVLDKVNSVKDEMNDFDKADTVQKLVESVLEHVKNSTNQITKTCADVKSEFSVKLKDRTLLVPPLSSNHSSEDKESHVADSTTANPHKEQESCEKEETISPEMNDVKPNDVNAKTTDSINRKPKPIKIKLNLKKTQIGKGQKNHSTSKRKTKNDLNTTVFTENSITEFNGIPIKKCCVQLTRIPLPQTLIT